jgi:hypothetical protein
MSTTVTNHSTVTPNPDPPDMGARLTAEAGTRPPAEAGAKLTAEAVIEELRTLQTQIEDVVPLPKAERLLVQRRLRTLSKPVVEASINVIGVLDNLSQAMGRPLEDVRQLQDDQLRWEAVADQARAFLKGIEGANLIRRQRLAVIATQAYTIGSQLAKDPDKAVLLPHVEEVKRLKRISRRKKATQAAPPPAPAPVEVPSTTPNA